MTSIVTVSPFRCRMWELHDRIVDHITEMTCKVEIASFKKHGQLVPALGRPLHGDRDFDVELVVGARRLFVARYLNRPIAVEVRDMTDREAIIAMNIENRQRADISPYERGMAYSRWLDAGYFKTQEEIARVIQTSASQVSRLLKLARMPTIVIDAFNGPGEICENWGLDIAEALENPDKREATLRAARAICSAGTLPPANEVYRRLLAASAQGRKPRVKGHDEVVKSNQGKPLFRIHHQASSIAILLPRDGTSAEALHTIRDFVSRVLQDENPHEKPDPPRGNAEKKLADRDVEVRRLCG